MGRITFQAPFVIIWHGSHSNGIAPAGPRDFWNTESALKKVGASGRLAELKVGVCLPPPEHGPFRLTNSALLIGRGDGRKSQFVSFYFKNFLTGRVYGT